MEDVRDEFARLIIECRGSKNKRSKRDVYNASIKHAAFAIKNLLEVAVEDESPVKIVSGNLKREFYENLTENINNVLNKGITVDLIVLNNENDIEDNTFVKAIKNSAHGKVLLPNEEFGKVTAPHFTLVGKSCYRVETDHAQSKAVICFNNEVIGGFLHDMFNGLSSKCSQSY